MKNVSKYLGLAIIAAVCWNGSAYAACDPGNPACAGFDYETYRQVFLKSFADSTEGRLKAIIESLNYREATNQAGVSKILIQSDDVPTVHEAIRLVSVDPSSSTFDSEWKKSVAKIHQQACGARADDLEGKTRQGKMATIQEEDAVLDRLKAQSEAYLKRLGTARALLGI